MAETKMEKICCGTRDLGYSRKNVLAKIEFMALCKEPCLPLKKQREEPHTRAFPSRGATVHWTVAGARRATGEVETKCFALVHRYVSHLIRQLR